MKIPPPPEQGVLRSGTAAPVAAVAARGERDRSFLLFFGVVLAALALSFKSELLAQGQVWVLALGLIVLASPALYGYLRGVEKLPAIEHYIPVALGATTLAGLAALIPELWKYALLAATFGTGFFLSARLDYLRLRASEKRGHVIVQEGILVLALAGAYLVLVTVFNNVILRLGWIFVVTFLASYRSFRINGIALEPRRALIFSLFVGQVVTFLAWAVIALQSYLVLTEGTFAVMLLFAWYINRGLVRHTVEESFTRHVVLEYLAFGAVLVYLFVVSYNNR